ncbi:MAG: thioredoxin family protein [Haloarculaceae archaeon]
MAMLTEQDREQIAEILADLSRPVTVHVFTDDCRTCDDAVELNRELAALAEEIDVEFHDLDGEVAAEYGADRYETGPVQVIEADGVSGVKYFGLPGGQEINSYLSDLVEVSAGESELPEDVKSAVREIDERVELKVFVTPTCPHCPGAVQTAHRFAIENDAISAEMIEAQEFMDVSQEYGVRGVPQINVNDRDGQFKGNQPPQQFLQEVQRAL